MLLLYVTFGFAWFVSMFVAAWFFYRNRTSDAALASVVSLALGLVTLLLYVPTPTGPSTGAVAADLVGRYNIDNVDVSAYLDDPEGPVRFFYNGRNCRAKLGVADVDTDLGWVHPSEDLPVPTKGADTEKRYFIERGTTICEVAMTGPSDTFD